MSVTRLLAVALCVATPWIAAARVDFAELETLVASELGRHQVPGCAIAVVVNGEVALVRGFGVANVETGEPVRSEMLFRLGSTTKMFTAAGLVMLAEQGRLRLDVPVGRYVPGLDPAIARLTSHQLLSHTAGLADPNAMNGPHDETALAERVRQLGPRDFFDEPGQIYSYANAGYWIAGLVAQVVSGKLYADHLDERLFQPLGMERTTFRPTMAMTWPFALGHGPEGRSPPTIIRPLADNAAVWPAGQLFSSAPEFARFCIAFMNGGPAEGKSGLTPFVVATLSAPHAAVPNEDRHYGYGLSVHTEDSLRWLSHNGSRTGYGSLMRMCPEQKFAVIILCNKTGASLPRVADRAAQIALGFAPRPEPARRIMAMTDAEMARYAGTYSNGRTSIVLRVRDGRLVGAQGSVVTRIGETRFRRAAAGNSPELEFTLVIAADGGVTHLMSRGRAWRRQD